MEIPLKPTKGTQRAQQYDRRDNKLHLNEIPIPQAQPNELLVKIACASLCHSDLMLFEPNDQGLLLGPETVTIGHEATGIVVEAGPHTEGFQPGDQVGFLPAIDCCFECYSCRNVHNLWCEMGKVNLQGFSKDGYFQEYVAIDHRQAIVLPRTFDVAVSGPLFCAGVTAYHGIDDCQLQQGQWIAIVGCGGLGHLGVQYAKAMGLGVIAVDIANDQLEEAKAQGADHIFNSSADLDFVAKILEVMNGGVDAAINFTASKDSYDDMPKMVRPGTGLIMVVGIPQQPLHINAFDIATGKFRLMGANNGTNHNLKAAIDFTAKHGIKAHLTTFQFEDVPKMIEMMQSGRTRGRLGVKFM